MARPKPLAEFVDATVGPAFAAQGFASADILAAWPDIVGERLAGVCQPLKLDWPHKPRGADPQSRPDPATLVVRVEGAFALEIQHLAPLLIERLNTHYGWRCVGRITLRQGRMKLPTRPRPPCPLDPAAEAALRAATGDIAEEPLREALDRLGHAVMTRGG